MTAKSQEKEHGLAVSEAKAIFGDAWKSVESRLQGPLTLPKNIYWLNGAPGAGKGTQTDFLKNHLALQADPIIISDLLKGPQAQKQKDAGLLVGDKEVFELLLEKLFEPEFTNGALVDGYPRTLVQLETLKLLTEKFSQVQCHFIVLFVDEEVSVERQLARGRQAIEASQEVRKTDMDDQAARTRYCVYKDLTYDALEGAKECFPYYNIDASGTVETVQENITKQIP